MMCMRNVSALAVALALAATANAQPASVKAAERVAALLGEPGVPPLTVSPPKSRATPAKIDSPEAFLPLVDAKPVLAPSPGLPGLKPVSPREPAPLSGVLGAPIVPVVIVFPTGLLAKQYVLELKADDSLPVLGAYVKDRVAVSDPTMELSARSILSAQNPERLTPVPFTPWNLPDPFEHVEAVRLRKVWAESPEPPAFLLPPTGR